MLIRTLVVFASTCLVMVLHSPGASAQDNAVVVMETSMGTITIELFEEQAPISVENFLACVDKEHYDGTIFHRVAQTSMIQGGYHTSDMQSKSVRDQIKNEAANGVENDKYTIAMTSTNEVYSATDQFFINTVDNDFLNGTVGDYGSAVFGRVTGGIDVVDRIAATPVTNNLPDEPVFIRSVRLSGHREDPEDEEHDEHGDEVSLVEVHLEVEGSPVIGESWVVRGAIHNHRDHAVTANREDIDLLMPDYMRAMGSAVWEPIESESAQVESIPIRQDEERAFTWTIDPMGDDSDRPSWLDRARFTIKNHLIYRPGEVVITAEVPFSSPDGAGIAQSPELRVFVGQSFWIVLSGAWIGGIALFWLQTLGGLWETERIRVLRTIGRLVLGTVMAVLLTSIAVILNDRLASAEVMFSLTVNDFWGAIAAGALIQWMGYSSLSRYLPPQSPDVSET